MLIQNFLSSTGSLYNRKEGFSQQNSSPASNLLIQNQPADSYNGKVSFKNRIGLEVVKNTQNSAVRVGDKIFDRIVGSHTLDRMKSRNISAQEIEEALRRGNIYEERDKMDGDVFMYILRQPEKRRILEIVASENKLITVMDMNSNLRPESRSFLKRRTDLEKARYEKLKLAA